jgi:hypothetical protein
VSGEAVAVRLDADMRANVGRAGYLLGSSPGKIDRAGASFVDFPGTYARRAHVR